MSFDLAGAKSAKELYRPQKFLIYGVQGIGKTTFGATFRDPILLRVEDGASSIDIPTFDEVVTKFSDVVEAIKALHGDHNFKTLVVDSLDWLEPIIWNNAVSRWNAMNGTTFKSLESIGYGKGYVEADKDWRLLLAGLDSLTIRKDMQIVLIAHADIKTFCPPDDEPYDRYQIKLQKRAFGIVQEWCDSVFFVNYKKTVIKTKDGGTKGQSKYRAKGDGERVIYTSERPAFYAKRRWHLPDQIVIGNDVNWAEFHASMVEATEGKYKVQGE
jgi:hypothetical protein